MERLDKPAGTQVCPYMTFHSDKTSDVILTVEEAAVGYDNQITMSPSQSGYPQDECGRYCRTNGSGNLHLSSPSSDSSFYQGELVWRPMSSELL